jgi:peptidoglycan/LPS O-acetylase OafA/YrhL
MGEDAWVSRKDAPRRIARDVSNRSGEMRRNPRMIDSRPQQTYIGLDLIRFGAALAVTVYHLGFWRWQAYGQTSANLFKTALAPASSIMRWGYLGVPVFFVLSGFIISASAVGRSAPEFLRGRVLRLYPAAWICIPITLLVFHSSPDLGLRIIHSLLLWPVGPWVSGVYWTLGVEIVFYLVVALALWGDVSLWRVGQVLGGMSALFWIARTIDFAMGSAWRPFYSGIEASVLGGLLVTQSCYFGVGITLWVVARDGVSWRKMVLLSLFLAAGCIAVFGRAQFLIWKQGGAPHLAIAAPLIWLSTVALIACSIKYQPLIWRRFGGWGTVARRAGLATYPLYLVHSELGEAVMIFSRGLGPWNALAIGIATAVGIAFAIIKLERLPRAALRQWLGSPKRHQTRVMADLP